VVVVVVIVVVVVVVVAVAVAVVVVVVEEEQVVQTTTTTDRPVKHYQLPPHCPCAHSRARTHAYEPPLCMLACLNRAAAAVSLARDQSWPARLWSTCEVCEVSRDNSQGENDSQGG
jgi:hypothetical protein